MKEDQLKVTKAPGTFMNKGCKLFEGKHNYQRKYTFVNYYTAMGHNSLKPDHKKIIENMNLIYFPSCSLPYAEIFILQAVMFPFSATTKASWKLLSNFNKKRCLINDANKS